MDLKCPNRGNNLTQYQIANSNNIRGIIYTLCCEECGAFCENYYDSYSFESCKEDFIIHRRTLIKEL